jgi:uncharacterized delta-60 repeat protein
MYLPESLERRTLFAAGDLDPTFGGDGIVLLHEPGWFDDVAVLPGGKLLAVGSTFTAEDMRDYFLARFNPDGSFDITFGGGDGKAFVDFGSNDFARRVAHQSDGKIIVYGTVLARFLPDGRLDASFGGGDGFVSFPAAPVFGGQPDGLAVDADDRIVIARHDRIQRYTRDGALDMTFGVGGHAATPPSAWGLAGYSPDEVGLQPSGHIVVAGEAYHTDPDVGGHGFDFIVHRLTPDGQYDYAFANGAGFLSADVDHDETVNRMAIAPDGRIAITGTEGDEEPHHLFVDRDGDNLLLTNLSWGYGTAWDIAFDSNGNTPSAGYQQVSEDAGRNKAIRAARDATFGRLDSPAGMLINLVPLEDDEIRGLAVEPDNDVVAVGRANDRPFILRFEGEPSSGILLRGDTLVIAGTAANDTISVELTGDTVVARVNAETRSLARSAVRTVIGRGNDGDDMMTLSGITGSLSGGAGNDVLRATGNAAVALSGSDGSDRLFGGDGTGQLTGGADDDVLVGGAGNNQLFGNGGRDTLDGAGGADLLDGGPGIDTADYSSRTADLVISIDISPGDGQAGENDDVRGIEKVLAGFGNDRISAGFDRPGYALFGNAGDDVLTGSRHPDALWGGAGNDVMEGNGGDDYLNGAAGDDTHRGGEGDDTFDDTRGNNTFDGGPGVDTTNGVIESWDQLLLQAEHARLSGATVSDRHAGYTGDGYVEFEQPRGGFIEWTVRSPSTGARRLEFRYANGTRFPRTMQVAVNGRTVVPRLDFPPSGSWTSWRTVAVDVPLTAGVNTIRLVGHRFAGPNVDSLTLRTVSASPRTARIEQRSAHVPAPRLADPLAGRFFVAQVTSGGSSSVLRRARTGAPAGDAAHGRLGISNEIRENSDGE